MIDYVNIKWICRDFTKIENYKIANSDTTQVWHCHHRKEIEDKKTSKQLKEEKLYYNRPPEELIFLTPTEHRKLHNTNILEDTRIKLSVFQKGKKRKSLSEETKRKISISEKGNKRSDEFRMKMSKIRKEYFNNKNIQKNYNKLKGF